MKVLRLEGQKDLPYVDFDSASGRFEMGGKSYPADVRVFYMPVIEWLQEYCKAPANHTELRFRFEYFNTASSKIILNLVDAIKPLADNGKLQIYWHYPDDDPELKEYGELMSDICNVDITYVEDEIVD